MGRQWWFVLNPNGRAMCTCESEENAKALARGYAEKNNGALFPVVRVREMTS